MTTKILTLGIARDDIEHLALDSENILLTALNLGDIKSTLDIEEEIDTILLDSHYSDCIKVELRTILGLTPPTTQIVLAYYADDELDLDNFRQLGIELVRAPLTADGWLARSHT